MASPSSVAVSSLETEAPQVAVTRERKLNPDLQEQLPKPCKHSNSIFNFIPSP
jgi:peroxygenase